MTGFALRHTRARDGHRLGFYEIPDGAPLVLLHSLGADGTMWADVVRNLPDGYRVIAPDTRGHGSSGPGATANVGQWVDDLEDVLTAAGIDSAVLAGVSMGGIQALAFAAQHPHRVRALVIADSFAELNAATVQAKVDTLAGHARTAAMTDVADQYLRDTFVEPVPAGAERVRRALAAMDAESYITAVRVTFSARITDRLPLVKAPTHVLWGERDDKTPRALSEQIVSAIPDAVFTVIPDAGHLSNIDNPEAFATALDQHASRHRGGM